jgi:hypothetical protein
MPIGVLALVSGRREVLGQEPEPSLGLLFFSPAD